MISKRGQGVQFLPYLLIGLVFVVGITIFIIPMMEVGDRIFDEMIDSEVINVSNTSVQNIQKVQVAATGWSDQLIFFLLGSILLTFIAVAIFSDFHPVFMGIFVLFIILMVIVAGVLANITDEVKETNALSDKADEFTMTNQVLGSHLPLLVGVFGAIAIIVLLAKRGKVSAPV